MQQFNPQQGLQLFQQGGMPTPTMMPQQSPTLPNLPSQGASPFGGGFDPSKLASMLGKQDGGMSSGPGTDLMQNSGPMNDQQWNDFLQKIGGGSPGAQNSFMGSFGGAGMMG